MLPPEFEPARQQERALSPCAPPRPTTNFRKLAPTGLSMTVLRFFWIPRQRTKTSCFSAAEQSSAFPAYPTRSYSASQEIKREPSLVVGVSSPTIQCHIEKRFCWSLRVWPSFLGPRKDTIQAMETLAPTVPPPAAPTT